MKFLVIGHVVHTQKDGDIFAYGPYVREMNLWFKNVDEVVVLAPLDHQESPDPIDLPYSHPNLRLVEVPQFNILSKADMAKTISKFPGLWIKTWSAMKEADHIHLRCPGNMGLLGAMVQTFFPNKIKSAKYAGNWDRGSKQPYSYRLQQKILSDRSKSKNMQVLVYGEWPNESVNIRPFFTASYSEKEIISSAPRQIGKDNHIQLIFAGGLNSGKQPMISAQVCKELLDLGYNAQLDFYGEGPERNTLKEFIQANHLEEKITLHGNVSGDTLKLAYQKAHFLIFISQSEGWPKVVAEAMFWGCLPITTSVSCVPQMLGHGERGVLVKPDIAQIVKELQYLIEHPTLYNDKVVKAMNWSRQFTLEKFEAEIQLVIFDRKYAS